jgi:hypothetical protein
MKLLGDSEDKGANNGAHREGSLHEWEVDFTQLTTSAGNGLHTMNKTAGICAFDKQWASLDVFLSTPFALHKSPTLTSL